MNLVATTDAAAGGGTDIGTILFQILVVLLAAKVAAELAERVNVPAVLGEIGAGILIGPSVLGLVEAGEVLHVLGELGVILLLFHVGMEMDLAELGKVGRASISVAVVGVAAPFVAGTVTGSAFGHDMKTSVFIGAALTATSVGITARVFGDLGALSTVESRIVLGAAVADDVLGLIILTIVARIVVDGSVSVGTILSVTGLAVAFLVITGVFGTRYAPRVFAAVHRAARSPSTLVAIAFAFTMGFAALADAARLAPIIGAFMAGIAIGRSEHAERIAHELTPVGHVFIPVFFLSIGIGVDVEAMARPAVLGLAAVLTVVAVVGKLVSAVGARGTRSDKLLIGLGMIPRGEVGLIFATLGLRTGVFDDDLYAATIIVVLVTTLMTPPLLRWRIRRTEPAATADVVPTAEPPGGWIGEEAGTIVLHGEPPPQATLGLALRSASLATAARPSTELLDWFAANRTVPLAWDAATTGALVELLGHANPRSWRLLETLGVLERALPDVAASLRARRADPAELDPTHVLRFPTVDRIGELAGDTSTDRAFAQVFKQLEHPEQLLVAAFVLDVAGSAQDATPIARRMLGTLTLPVSAEHEVGALVSDAWLLRHAARDPDSFDEMVVRQMADHIGSTRRLHAEYLLSVALGDMPEWQRAALDDVRDAVARHTGEEGELTLCDARRAEAQLLTRDPAVIDRIAHAPRSYVLTHEPEELVSQATLAEPPPRPGTARVAVTGEPAADTWRVDVAAQDRPGLLARIAAALTVAGMDIVGASVATWGDGAVVGTFHVRATRRPTARGLADAIEASLRAPLEPQPVTSATVVFDNTSLPWQTSCVIEADDRPGLLAALATAFATADAEVHWARIATKAGLATDRFALTDRNGHKLDNASMGRIRRALAGDTDRAARRRLAR